SAEFDFLGADLLAHLFAGQKALRQRNRAGLLLDLGPASNRHSLSSGMDLGPEPLRASSHRAHLRHALSSCSALLSRGAGTRDQAGTPFAQRPELGAVRNRLGS